MRRTKVLTILVLALALMLWPVEVSEAAPMGTAFTYQGRLMDANSAADGLYDFVFKLYDGNDPCDANEIGGDVNKPDVDVIDGYFTAKLDFGTEVFHGDDVWLHIGVRPGEMNDPNGYTPLSPLQEITAVPYALHTRGIFVDEAGNVGISTTRPTEKLHVNGDIKVNNIRLGNSDIKDKDSIRMIIDLDNDQTDQTFSVWKDGTAGTELFRIQENGNVGIGTTNPLSKLSVGGSGLANTGVYGSGTYSGVRGEDSNSGSYGVLGWHVYGVVGVGSEAGIYGTDSDTTSYGRIGYDTYGVYGRGSDIGVYGRGSDTGVYGEDSDTLCYGRLGYDTWGGYFSGDGYFSGNVGIGTTSPAYPFHLKKIYEASWIAGIHNQGVGPNAKGLVVRADGGDPFMVQSYPGKIIMNVKQNGNVGIGTTSPDATLEISGILRVARETNNAHGADFSYVVGEPVTGHDGLIIDSDTGGSWSDIHLRTLGTTKLFVESAGNVGIGTTSPSGVLYTSSKNLEIQGIAPSIVLDDTDGTAQNDFEIVNGGDKVLFRDATAGIDVMALELSGTRNTIVRTLEITGGSDLSERFEVSAEDEQVKPGMVVCIDPESPGDLVVSKTTYDRTVAGIVSGAGGVKPGMLMGQEGTEAYGKHPVALSGRVYCWADASNSPIEPGDLLTTSNTPGHAMKVMDYEKAQGAILGKAMTRLESGEKELVLVLVALQ
jgi:hypothetical protein